MARPVSRAATITDLFQLPEFMTQRFERSLYLQVCEARKLRAMDITGSSDPYAVVECEGAQRRTRTVWESLEPFWGEDFDFAIAHPETAHLVVSVMDQDWGSKDDPIGQLVCHISGLTPGTLLEQWHPLQPFSTKKRDVVKGSILLEILYTPRVAGRSGNVSIKAVSGRDLAAKDANGLSDPFVEITIGKDKWKSKVIKETLNPEWNEEYFYTLTDESAATTVLVEVWDWDKVGNDFMGQVKLSLSDLEPGTKTQRWFLLTPRGSSSSSSKGGAEAELGDVRLKIKYSELLLLPLADYKQLIDLLMEDVGSERLPLLSTFGSLTTEKEEVAGRLIRLFEIRRTASALIKPLLSNEIDATENPDIIFRGNSLATKAMDVYQKTVGKTYLAGMLGPVIDDILKSKLDCEIDPSKADKKADLKKNFANLQAFVEKAVEAIFSSAAKCPAHLRLLYQHLQWKVTSRYAEPKSLVARYSAVSGFLFLRFLCPAILGPKLFHLTAEHPPPQSARTLTLVAKVVMNLANLAEFGQKEPYMAELNPYIKRNFDRMKQFLDLVSTPSMDGNLIESDRPDNSRLQSEMAHLTAHLFRNGSEIDRVLAPIDQALATRFQSVMKDLNDKIRVATAQLTPRTPGKA